jgi:hypothetical protein
LGSEGHQWIKGSDVVAGSMVSCPPSKARVIPTRPAVSATKPWLNSLSSSIRSRNHSTPGDA